jgi:hypothetical protein
MVLDRLILGEFWGGNRPKKFSGWVEIRIYEKYRYLAINTGSSTLISITYIVFVTKMQKGKPSKKDLPLLKNDITGSELTFKTTDT